MKYLLGLLLMVGLMVSVVGCEGPMGPAGESIQGEKGDTGATGERGIQGRQGEKGDTGEPGPPSYKTYVARFNNEDEISSWSLPTYNVIPPSVRVSSVTEFTIVPLI